MIIGTESETVEFKKTTGEKKEAMEAISAILNKHCRGTLYFGVDDSGFVQGQQISDSTKKDISRFINDSIEPRITPTIEVLTIEQRNVIKVSFSGHNRPYSVNGRYLIRTGTENRKMSTDELKRLIKNEDYSSKWEEELTDYSYDDLDDNSLQDFFRSAKGCGRLVLDSYDKEKLLLSIDLVKNGSLKNAAYALFGKNARIWLKLASYATDNKVTITDLKLIEGNIYNLVDKALDYVLNRINWRVEIGTRKREEIPEIPEKAIREIIVNSFAHADYTNSPEIEIGIHPGKIEIYNPGTFPDELTPIDFISKNLPSYKRNRLILDVLFRSRDVEKSGTGFQRVNEYCNQQNVKWSFRKEAYGFFFEFVRTNGQTVVQTNNDLEKQPIENTNNFQENVSGVQTNVRTNIQTVVQTNGQKKNELSVQEQTVLDIIRNNEGLSKAEIAGRIGKSERSTQRIISNLIKKDLVVPQGANQSRTWKIKE